MMENSNSNSNIVNNNEDICNDDDTKKINEIVFQIIGDDNEANRLNKAMENLRKKVGLLPLESPDFEPKTMLEEVIYNMRWNPRFFSDCDILTIHEYEMVLCAHITWVKGRENRWMSAYEIEKKSFDRAVSQAAKLCTGKTIEERKSEAIFRSKILSERARQLQIYKLYADQCANISVTFLQMDNCLKQMINTRRIELENSRRQ